MLFSIRKYSIFLASVFLCLCFNLISVNLHAQAKLSIDKVYSAYLRTSGTISTQGQIKGYFFLYQSDKIDRHTNEYTLQILDENLNKVRDIKFEDSKKLSLLESAYNGTSLSFMFKNEDTKKFHPNSNSPYIRRIPAPIHDARGVLG